MPVTPSLVRCQEHFYRVIDSRFDSFGERFECFTGLHDTESNRAEEMLQGVLAHNQGGGCDIKAAENYRHITLSHWYASNPHSRGRPARWPYCSSTSLLTASDHSPS
jgi:hypothetical protein